MTSVAPLRDGEDRDLECLRPSKMQRISREDDQPPKFPGPWKMIQKKGVNFLDDRFRLRKVREVKRVETDSNKQKLWEKTFDRLVEYIARYGDSNVPVYFKDRELVAWVAEQRRE